MSKFKIGDKVRICNVKDHRRSYNGKEKVITSINPNAGFMEPLQPHYSVNEIYIFYENELELIPKDNTKIVITTNGNETLARLYDGKKIIKTATAKCSPDDTFDALIGAKIAFDRLIGEEKKAEEKPSKYKMGDKVRVIKNTCHHYCKIGETVTLGAPYTTIAGEKAWDVAEHGGYITKDDIEPIKFNVGDRVKIIDSGKKFSTYVEWFTKNAPELAGYYRFDSSAELDEEYKIRRIAPHLEHENKTLYAIQNPKTDYVYLIGEEGIEKV